MDVSLDRFCVHLLAENYRALRAIDEFVNRFADSISQITGIPGVMADNIEDHFSSLPSDILSYILTFLPLKDAVRTRVLATRWRYLCASTRNLHFDISSIFGISYDGVYLPVEKHNLWEHRHKFVNAVDQFLTTCRRTDIHSFRISYCLGHEYYRNIDNWIKTAIKKHTKHLELNFSYIPQGRELYKFPCLRLQIKGSMVEDLCLRNCMLKPSKMTNCYGGLRSVELFDVPLDNTSFNDFLCGCKNLESFKLRDCILPNTIDISGKQLFNLKLLVLLNCEGVLEMKISSIELKTFEYRGPSIKLAFDGVRSLQKLALWFVPVSMEIMDYIVNEHAKQHPLVEKLLLFVDTLKPLPTSMPKFSHLKELDLLLCLSASYDLLNIAFLLKAAPCLQKFHLGIQWFYLRGPLVKAEGYCSDDVTYYQLKEVEISGFVDKSNVLEFVSHLLSHAVILQRMIVSPKRRSYNGDGKWNNNKYPVVDEFEKERIHNLISKDKVNTNVELIVR